MERYTDTISGEELYVDDYESGMYYYKDRAMTIRHRLDGPAIEWADGSKEWFVDGKQHRLDGPAFESASGSKAWYVDDKRHRIDGPAYESASGSKTWMVNGKRHRLDGPAVEYADGRKEWYVDGVFIIKTKPDGKIILRMK